MPVFAILSLMLTQASDLSDPERFRSAVASAGYRWITAFERNPDRIERDGVKLEVGLTQAYPGGVEQKPIIKRCRVSIELAFPKEVPDGRSPLVFSWDPPEKSEHISYVSHLGRTVTVERTIEVNPALTPRTLKAKLDEFWDAARNFAREHGGHFSPAPEVDWIKQGFSDDIKLERADPVSLERLTQSWGWRYHGGWGFSGVPRWVFPITIDGKHFWVSEDGNSEGRVEDRFSFYAFDAEGESNRIEVGKGLRVGDLRRLMEAIVRRTPKPE